MEKRPSALFNYISQKGTKKLSPPHRMEEQGQRLFQ